MNNVRFQLVILIRKFSIQNKEPILIDLENRNFRAIFIDNEKKPEHSGIIVEKVEDVSNQDIYEGLVALSKNRLPKKIRMENLDEYINNGKIEKVENGEYRIKTYPIFDLFTEDCNKFISGVYGSLSSFSTEIINTLFWKNGIMGLANPKSMGKFSFKLEENKDFYELHLPIMLSIDIGQGILFTDKTINELITCLQSEDCLPTVGHELWREAWHNRHQNPRSACVLAIASVESSIVEYISRKIPDAEWIITNLPKPNLLRILNEYMRKIIGKGQKFYFFPLNKKVYEKLRTGIDLRNYVMHTGRYIPSDDELESILIVCKDILYMLDYHFGNQWADKYISKYTKELYKYKEVDK